MSIFVLDGAIGAGKSTIISALGRRNSNFKVCVEPVERFQNCCGENLLQKLYANENLSAFTLQCHISQCMTDVMQSIDNPTSTTIVERGIDSGQRVFASTLFHLGKLSAVEFHLLENYYNAISKALKGKITFYLRTDLETLIERIEKRNRLCENKITSEYLKMLLFEYERFYVGFYKSFEGKVFVIDATQEESKIVDEIETIIKCHEIL